MGCVLLKLSGDGIRPPPPANLVQVLKAAMLMKAGLGTSLALELLTRGRRGAETQKGRHCQNGAIGYALYKPTYPVRHNHNLHSLITPTELW
jgi:hypothetical protein